MSHSRFTIHDSQVHMNRLLLAAAVIWLAYASFAGAQQPLSPSAMRAHPNINYLSGTTTDPVARLNEKLRSGSVV